MSHRAQALAATSLSTTAATCAARGRLREASHGVPMRILMTNLSLRDRTGTEIVTRDLALALAARGHHVEVYSPVLGEIAEEIQAGGVLAAARLEALARPEIIHGQHHMGLMTALARLPTAPAVMYLHDRLSLYD